MKIDLVTFNDLRERAEIDIIGGTIEISCAKDIMRGTIDDIFWWSRRHPSKFEWTDGVVWNKRQGIWNHTGDGVISFNFPSFEYFSGPYQMESGELFFTLRKVLHTIIFPVGYQSPDIPYNWRECENIHCQFMGIKPPGRMPT